MEKHNLNDVIAEQEGNCIHFQERNNMHTVGYDTKDNCFARFYDYLSEYMTDQGFEETIYIDMSCKDAQNDELFRAKADEKLAEFGVKLGAHHQNGAFPYFDLIEA